MTAIATLPVLFQEGDHASRPAAGDVGSGALYSCTTHSLIYQTDGSSWTTWATLGGTPSGTAGGDLSGTYPNPDVDAIQGVTISGTPTTGDVPTATGASSATWQAPTAGGSSDIIFDTFGTPDTAYEFDTSSLTGLTSLGTSVTEDADTSVPGHYYVLNKQNANPYWSGRYDATVTQPFTAITLCRSRPTTGMHAAGLMLAAASPGAFDFLFVGYGAAGPTYGLFLQRWTSNAAFGSTIYTDARAIIPPTIYLAIVAHSNTNVDYLYSVSGGTWYHAATARDPSLTLGSIGLVASAQETSVGNAAAFEYLRIWNSALTFPA